MGPVRTVCDLIFQPNVFIHSMFNDYLQKVYLNDKDIINVAYDLKGLLPGHYSRFDQLKDLLITMQGFKLFKNKYIS